MACQCINISKCKHDIRVLTQGNKTVKELIDIDSNVEDKLNELANLYTQSFTVTNMSELVSRNNELNDRINELFLQLNTRITGEIEYLEGKLKHFTHEDRKFHKEHTITFTW